jgi:anti-sigma regulatory factor (Ser/Thr protein kinase)
VRIIAVPASLDYTTIDEFFRELAQIEETHVLFDARHLRWTDPNGMLALLAAARAVTDRLGTRPKFTPPESSDVIGYLSRMDFFGQGTAVFDFDQVPTRRNARASDVLLEITPIAENRDVHAAVDHVQSRAGQILSKTLGYAPTAVVRFSVVLSEVCQNILEHAEAPGWVAAQTYNWAKRLGREVVVMSVMDVGCGFRGSLAHEHAARFGDRWADATALEAAFIHGLTRFPDSGRGQGIQQIRRQVSKWDGFLSIRSGTARIADVPSWDDSPPLEDSLPEFPGAQINIILPAKAQDGRA